MLLIERLRMNAADLVLAALAENKLLLKQDKVVPNVVSILTGESLRASWWSHPKGRLIFAVLSQLAGHPDVLFAKLLDGKDTLIYRPLWPACSRWVARENRGKPTASRPARNAFSSVSTGERTASAQPVRPSESSRCASSPRAGRSTRKPAVTKWRSSPGRRGRNESVAVPPRLFHVPAGFSRTRQSNWAPLSRRSPGKLGALMNAQELSR